MLEPLYNAAEMRAAEEGHDVTQLMERAGAAVAREVLQRFPDARRIAVVCGGGSNGGDGRIAARILREEGCDAVETTAVEQADVIVDALFGTGFHGEPRAEAAATIGRINAAGAPVVSVDVPSGVDASTGEIAGEAVRATLTVTFHGVKAGLAIAPGLFHTGDVTIAEIGLEPAETELRLVTPAILAVVPRRRPWDNKYTAGAVLVAGGSPGMTGAVCLAAEAAFRADAGYVAVAVPERSLPIVEARLLEPVKVTWAGALQAAEKAGALAIGPGLGREPDALRLRDELLAAGEQPVVLDADALHELEPGAWAGRAVLTPHAGRAGAPARRGVVLGGRAPPRGGTARRGPVRRRLPAQGRRHDRRRSRRGSARLRHEGARAGHGRDRRRADGDPGRVPGQGRGASPRRGGCRHRPRSCGAEQRQPGRDDRERRDRRAPVRPLVAIRHKSPFRGARRHPKRPTRLVNRVRASLTLR